MGKCFSGFCRDQRRETIMYELGTIRNGETTVVTDAQHA